MAAIDNRIPVTVLSGFLGSGKTTLLNHLLHDSRLTDTAVIVNEFGEVGLDHLLVESAFDEMVLMDNGCLCCSVRGDLVDTLNDLRKKAEGGEIPPFSRIMVETTGLADPGPIAQTLATDEDVAGQFSLHGIVVTLDAVNGVSTLGSYAEARAQVAMADLLVLTKTDLAAAAGARGAARELNPHAPIVAAENGALDPEVILSLDPARPALTAPDGAGPGGDDGGEAARAHDHHAHGAHGAGHIQTATVFFDGAVAWDLLSGWLEWMTALRGPDILRIKGIVEVSGFDGPVLIHGVQHAFYPPRVLDGWPDADRRGRIVVIARDVPAEAIRASFARYREWQRPAG